MGLAVKPVGSCVNTVVGQPLHWDSRQPRALLEALPATLLLPPNGGKRDARHGVCPDAGYVQSLPLQPCLHTHM
jgi:hypothetical protein